MGAGEAGEADQFQVLPHQPLLFPGRPAVQAEGHVLFHRQPGKEAVLLKDHPPIEPRTGDAAATQPHLSAVAVLQAGDDAQQGALAAAAGADDGDELPCPDLQVDLLQGGHLAGLDLEFLVEPGDDQAAAG